MDPLLKDKVISETEAALQAPTLGLGGSRKMKRRGTVRGERECRLWKSPRPWSEELLARVWLWT